MAQDTGYTDNEIKGAVGSLIRTTIRRPVDSLGVRQIGITFNDVQEAASGLFLLNPTAPLYVISLAASRLLEAVRSEAAITASLVAALRAAGRDVFPINNLTPLNNANAALFELGSAVGSRNSSFKTITSTPAFQRFSANVDLFLKENGPNVKSNGQIVQTPQGAKTQIRALMPQVQAAHEEVLRRVALLRDALDDYNAINLPTLAAAGVIDRSRETVARIAALLAPQEPTQRLSSLRDVVLALLSTRAVMREIGTFTGPGPIFLVVGQGAAFSDSAHLANGAVLKADKFAPYNIANSPPLTVTLNGGVPFTINLSNALYAEASGVFSHNFQPAAIVLGSKNAPFNIVLTQNDSVQFFLFDPIGLLYVDVVVPLTAGLRTATQISADINTAIGLAGLAASYQASPVGTQVQVAALFVGPDARVVVGGAAGANRTIGFTQTGGFNFLAAAVARVTGTKSGPFDTTVNNAFQLSLQHPQAKQPVYLQVPLTIGVATAAAQIAIDINNVITTAGLATSYQAIVVGPQQVAIESLGTGQIFVVTIGGGNANSVLGFDPGEQSKGTSDNRQLFVTVPGAPGSPFTVTLVAKTYSAPEAAADIGTALGPTFQVTSSGSADKATVVIRFVGNTPPTFTASLLFASPNPAADVLGFLTDVPYTSRQNTARQVAKNLNQLSTDLTASSEVVAAPGASGLFGRSDPTDPARVVAYRYFGAGVLTSPAAFTIQVQLSTAVTLVPLVGDKLAIREGVNAGSLWTITGVAGTVVTATGFVAAPPPGVCTLDIGPDLGALPGWVVEIPSGVDNGIYSITQQAPLPGSIPFEFELDGLLPAYQDSNLRSVFFTINVGQERLTVASKDRTTASSVVLSNVAASLFFAVPPGVGTGTTPWFKLPTVVRGVGNDDLLEYYNSNYAVPDAVFTVTSVENQILGLTPAIDSLLTPQFDPGSPPPFVRLRSTAFKRFATMQAQLITWLTLAPNLLKYFPELQRVVNIVLVEGNPTSVQVGDAVNQANKLPDILLKSGSSNPNGTLEAILAAYTVPRVDSIDELIRTYREKGSARAIDVLLEARFSDFFGLDAHSVSYSGAMLSQLRTIAQQDIPVRKLGRKNSNASELQSTSQSPNFEYDTTDGDKAPSPDAPSAYEQIPHGPDPSKLA